MGWQNLEKMYINCPKCKNENWNETVTINNNPNLVTCQECRYSFFVELKLVYKKAYKHTGGYSLIKSELNTKIL